MYDRPLSPEQVLSALGEQAAAIAGLTAGLLETQLTSAPRPGEWSLNDVLAHLRACADVWGGYMARIAAEDHPTIRAVNPRTWIERTDYRELDFRPSFRAYQRQRADLLDRLRRLPPEAWSRSAVVTGGGRPRERTVLDYAQWLANHERSHLRQIRGLAGRG